MQNTTTAHNFAPPNQDHPTNQPGTIPQPANQQGPLQLVNQQATVPFIPQGANQIQINQAAVHPNQTPLVMNTNGTMAGNGASQVSVPVAFYASGIQQPFIYCQPPSTNVRNHYKSQIVTIIGLIQIFTGIFCVIASIVDITLGNPLGYIGSGIWGGLPFIITGALGLMSSKSKTTCSITAFMVMCIISAIISIGPIVCGSLAWAYASGARYWHRGFQADVSCAMNGIIVFSAVTNGFLGIFGSICSCCGVCAKPNSTFAVQMPHFPNAQPQTMFVSPQYCQPLNIGQSQAMVTTQMAPTNVQTSPVVYPQTSEPAGAAASCSDPPPGYNNLAFTHDSASKI